MSLLLADFVAKRFLASERRTFFSDWARIENFGSKIQPFGFYYCPFLLISGSAATFATVSALNRLAVTSDLSPLLGAERT
jgi:hypothetical protein